MVTSDLSTALDSLSSEYSLQERVTTLGEIMDWVRLPVKTTHSEDVLEYVHSRDVRIKFLFSFLERHPEKSQNLANTIQDLIQPGSAVGLYCLTGLSSNSGFFTELGNRIVQRILPDTYSEEDLSEIFKVLFKEEEDAVWIEHSLKNIQPLFEAFAARHSISFDNIRADRKDSMVILGAQVATLGSSKEFRRRLPGKRLTNYSFIKLNAMINSENFTEEQILEEITRSRLDLQTVRNNIESSGVSVDLIFKMEKMNSTLNRIETLIYLSRTYSKTVSPIVLGQFFSRLIRDEMKNQGVKVYIQENLHLLTRKIVERSGEKGEHYIATTKEEKHHLFVAATWAGVLTAFTALAKFLISAQKFSIFFEGFFFFINYAIGFLLLQKWHLALSSKQPAYTASALSKKFEDFKKTKELSVVIQEVKKIANSQFLTTVGNLLWVVPVAILLDYVFVIASGDHLMTVKEARYVLHKHNIFTSFTIPFAFLTGILLWLSSVVGGWIENWLVFRDVPETMRTSPVLKKVFGKDQLNNISNQFAGTMGGIIGNITIAFFLSAPWAIGKFMGFNLDIRHVTLGTGTITLAFNALEWNIFEYWDQMIIMILSISMIGFLNFSVSFYCAIRMAAIARGIDSKYIKTVFKYSFSRRGKEGDRAPSEENKTKS